MPTDADGVTRAAPQPVLSGLTGAAIFLVVTINEGEERPDSTVKPDVVTPAASRLGRCGFWRMQSKHSGSARGAPAGPRERCPSTGLWMPVYPKASWQGPWSRRPGDW